MLLSLLWNALVVVGPPIVSASSTMIGNLSADDEGCTITPASSLLDEGRIEVVVPLHPIVLLEATSESLQLEILVEAIALLSSEHEELETSDGEFSLVEQLSNVDTVKLAYLATSPLWNALYYIAAVGIVLLLLALIYWDLTTDVPTSGRLAKDLEYPIPMTMWGLGKIVDYLCPWTLFDISDPHVLLVRAANRAGLEPNYAPPVVKSLERLCESFRNNQVEFHFYGRWIMHATIVTGLTQYLEVEEAFRRNPGLASTKLNKPVVVAGLPRSGTTYLHRVLSTAPDSYSPPLWEHFYPVPPRSGWDYRRCLFKFQFLAWRFLAKRYGINSIHFVDPEKPDECNFSMRLGGASHLYYVMAPVYDYIDWLGSKSDESIECLNHSYEIYRKIVLIWQAQHPHKRLVLKSPSHALHLQKLIRIIPEANVVLTHRGNSADLIASEVSLFSRLHKTLTDNIDLAKSIQYTADKTFKYSHNMVDFCMEFPDRRVFHSSYEKLVSPRKVDLVREIHAYFDIPLTEEFEKVLLSFLGRNGNQQHAKGKHLYCLDDTGYTEDYITLQSLGRYRAFFSSHIHN